MRRKLVFCALFLLVLLVLLGKSGMGTNEKTSPQIVQASVTSGKKEKRMESIFFYDKGKKKNVASSAKSFASLRENIEKFAETANSSYKLFFDVAELEEVKRKGKALELVYASPKKMRVQYLADFLGQESLVVSKILLPLSKERYPEDLVFLLTLENELYYVANTKMKKKEILSLIQ
jgi:hypothetical protein